MKRFITYLYLYEQGQKTINVGFIRVDIRHNKARMEFSVRNLSRFQEIGKICMLVHKNELIGIELEDMRIINGQGSKTIEVNAIDIMESGFSMEDVVGVSIDFQNKGFVASCWKDDYANEISKGEIHIHPWIPPQLEEIVPVVINVVEKEEIPQEEPLPVVEPQEPEITAAQEVQTPQIIYKKIDLGQIHSLPSKNWYLCNNSFLIHGFWNYGYLVLKKMVSENETTLALGIPGIYEKPEMLMAVLFGFPEFEAIPEEIKEANLNIEKSFSKKENQEPEVGTFGCWFINLQI